MEAPRDKRTKEYKQWKAKQEALKADVGLGDVVDKITTKTGIKKAVKLFSKGKDCGCEERKKKWNEIKLFKTRLKPVRCFTEEEYVIWENFKKERTLRLSSVEIKMVCSLYSEIFGKPYYEPCFNCTIKPLIRMIDVLDAVFDNY